MCDVQVRGRDGPLPAQGAGRPQFMTRSSSNDKADNGRIFMIVGILCIAAACVSYSSLQCRAHPRCNDGHFRMLLKLWKNQEIFMTKDPGR